MNYFRKFLAIVIACSALAMPASPVAAQDARAVEKRYCPYCGVANLKTSKFCNACGARLPDRMPLQLYEATSHKHDSLETTNRAESNYRQSSPVADPIAVGLLMGTIGFFGGALVGYEIDKITSDYEGEWDGFDGVLIGAPIGESLLLPVGVHLANGRRGNLPLAMLASIGIAGTGIALAASADNANILVAIPIAQLIACFAIERSASRNTD